MPYRNHMQQTCTYFAVAYVVPAAVRVTVQNLGTVAVREPVPRQARDVDAPIGRVENRHGVHHPRRWPAVTGWKRKQPRNPQKIGKRPRRVLHMSPHRPPNLSLTVE